MTKPFEFVPGQKVRIDNEFSVFNGYIFTVNERKKTDENIPRNMYQYRSAWFDEGELIAATPNDEDLKTFFTEAMQGVQRYDFLHCIAPYPLLLTASLYVKFKIEERGSPLSILRNVYVYGWMIPGDEGVQELSKRLLALMSRGEYIPPYFSGQEFIENHELFTQRILT